MAPTQSEFEKMEKLDGTATIFATQDKEFTVTLDQIMGWNRNDMMNFFERVCSAPQRFGIGESDSRRVRKIFFLLRTRIGQNAEDLWWVKESSDGRKDIAMIEHVDVRFNGSTMRSLCTSDLVMAFLTYVAKPSKDSTRGNFYLPYLVAAARMLDYQWSGPREKGPYMASVLFTEPGSNKDIVPPILGISLPSWHPLHEVEHENPLTAPWSKKQLAQAERRNYLSEIGGYDLSKYPNPTPDKNNAVGNGAETWGHCFSHSAEPYQAAQLGGISIIVQKVGKMQDLSKFRNATFLRLPCDNCKYFICKLCNQQLIFYHPHSV